LASKTLGFINGGNMIIAGDIGSARSYMGIYKSDDKENPVLVFPSDAPKQYDSADYSSLESMMEAFLQAANVNEPIYAGCFAISGQPENGYIIGLNWKFSEEQLCDFWVEHCWKKKIGECDEAQFKQLPIVRLVNNMEAIDFKLLESGELVELNDEANTANDKDKFGRPFKRALIGVRGGLGEALFYWGRPPSKSFDPEMFNTSPSEGEHANFAPSSKEEVELLNYFLEHPKYLEVPELVTYRDVLSEKGIVSMYQFFKHKTGGNKAVAPDVEKLIGDNNIKSAAREIIIKALEKKNALCERAIDLFLSIYGAEAGNLALKYYALGGVYIHAPITPPELVDKLIDKLKQGAFMQAFTRRATPQVVDLLKSIPVKFVKDANIRLHGAARRALNREPLAHVLYKKCKK
jgi:glucokinase